jgi:hypothetical protein
MLETGPPTSPSRLGVANDEQKACSTPDSKRKKYNVEVRVLFEVDRGLRSVASQSASRGSSESLGASKL